MAKPTGSIEIVRGGQKLRAMFGGTGAPVVARLGKPFSVYAANGTGQLARHDYATAGEARAAARALARTTGWRITDQLDAAAPTRSAPAKGRQA